jgi:hypothetical protein
MSKTVQSESHSLEFESHGLEHIRFYSVTPEIIMAVFVKERFLHMSMSFESGLDFIRDEKLIELEGELKDLQILARANQFVIGILEDYAGTDRKRAIAGWIFPGERRFRFKECTETEIQGKIINISLGFRETEQGRYESVDYVFLTDTENKIHRVATGHPCILT